ncbi:MAG: alpha/beta fold hydrolase [Thermaerobacter sp.]|nr:alpha/beta fold hydrolase [Thermaerobacter sp.]
MLVTRAGPPPEGDAPHPLLVLLHGLGTNEGDLTPMADGLDRRLQLVFVRAPESAPAIEGGYQWFARGEPSEAALAGALASLRDTLTVLVTSAVSEGATPPLFLGGFSQGATVAIAYACREPAPPLAGLILLSGYLPEVVAVPPLRGLPVFLGHGQDDPVIEYARGRAMADRLAMAGARLMRRMYQQGHTVSPQELADVDVFLKGRLRQARRVVPPVTP